MSPSAAGCRLARVPYCQTSVGMSCSSTCRAQPAGSGSPWLRLPLLLLALPLGSLPLPLLLLLPLLLVLQAAPWLAAGLRQLSATTAPFRSGSTASSTARRPGSNSSGKAVSSQAAGWKLYDELAAVEKGRVAGAGTGGSGWARTVVAAREAVFTKGDCVHPS